MPAVPTSLAHLGRRRIVVRALRAARGCCGESGAALSWLGPRQQARVSGALARAEARAAWPLPWALERRLPAPARHGGRDAAPDVELEVCLSEAAGAIERLSPHPIALGVAAELLEMITTLESGPAGRDEARETHGMKIVSGLPARG